MTWMDEAVSIISSANAALPPDADLKSRKKAIRNVRPPMFSSTSWGKKVWPKAVRQVLAPYGYKTIEQVPKRHLSPLERMMRRAGA